MFLVAAELQHVVKFVLLQPGDLVHCLPVWKQQALAQFHSMIKLNVRHLQDYNYVAFTKGSPQSTTAGNSTFRCYEWYHQKLPLN